MAVNGHAAGIGATIQLPAAIRVASATARIGYVCGDLFDKLAIRAHAKFELVRFSRAVGL